MKAATTRAASSSAVVVRGPNSGEWAAKAAIPSVATKTAPAVLRPRRDVIVNRQIRTTTSEGTSGAKPTGCGAREARRPMTTTCTMTIAEDTSHASKGSRR